MDTAVEINRLRVNLGRRKLFESEQIQIQQGAFVGLLGSNGAGKTTLLRTLLGLQKAHYQTLNVLGTTCHRGHPFVSYLPQLKAQSSRLSIAAIDLMHSWRPRRVSRDDWQQRIDWVLSQVSGLDLARRPLDKLSGGEYQRLMLAQALLNYPKLLLLDEPLVGLDPNHQYKLVRLIHEIKTKLNMTIICCTHELNPFINHFDSLLLIHQQTLTHGSIQALLTSQILSELYHCHLDIIGHRHHQLFIAHSDADLYV
ncbi:ATP-binding cassette domain-containing protein [Celerinatantimonas sp. YJH-8]|uniref:ATP-binding cassette domain-containing protein n=1 Tax=Celerinatantimonas sp. YJH-8 TaxID=3228714 RepID=UPI0038BEF977